MTIWAKYPKEQQEEYIQFLQVYGALTNLFRQKHGNMIPYLDSKFQETVFARVFKSENVDIGNTPHDILSVFGNERIGIGLKTWMNTKPSYQKVMQLKRYQEEINPLNVFGREDELAYTIASIKNERLQSDYERLGLNADTNIYHYITRDENRFVIQESAYPCVNLEGLCDYALSDTSFTFSDGLKKYKYTFGDSQIWQRFDAGNSDTTILRQFGVGIIDDPFEFLMKAYFDFKGKFEVETKTDVVEAYLPLYSYRSKEVEEKSGLNAWNASPKNKGSQALRPLNEVYIPVPKEFHDRNPDFFVKGIGRFIQPKTAIEFTIHLPNGEKIPGRLTGDNLKNFQSGSQIIKKPNGKRYGQADLGQWLLVDVLGLKERQLVTRAWLAKRGTDSVKIWRKKDDYENIYVDFAPFGSFEAFMSNQPIPIEDN